MCTLIAIWRAHPSAPLILALNRDERLTRPTDGPGRWQPDGAGRAIVSGRDRESGGTWFAVGPHVTAALTNHREGLGSRRGVRSRGDLVVRAAMADSVDAFEAELEAQPMAEYGAFHMLMAGRRRLRWLTNRALVLEAHDVGPGVHVLGNYGLDHPDDPVVRRVTDMLEGALDLDADALEERLRRTLSDHGPGGPCVHMDGYGTRSSSILFWSWGERAGRLLATDGPPCQVAFRDLTPLLATL